MIREIINNKLRYREVILGSIPRIKNTELHILGSNKKITCAKDFHYDVDELNEDNLILKSSLRLEDNQTLVADTIVLSGKAINYSLLCMVFAFEIGEEKYYVINMPDYMVVGENRTFTFLVDMDIRKFFM